MYGWIDGGHVCMGGLMAGMRYRGRQLSWWRKAPYSRTNTNLRRAPVQLPAWDRTNTGEGYVIHELNFLATGPLRPLFNRKLLLRIKSLTLSKVNGARK